MLNISHINEWLSDNRNEYQKLKLQEFPLHDNEVYWIYNHLDEFIKYYSYIHKCNKAVQDLGLLLQSNFSRIIKWTQVNEALGSEQLLMFEINYINWNEDVSNDKIKIHKGLYTERKPFANIICFCKVFQHLYWDNRIHEVEPTQSEKVKVITELKNILETYYIDKV